MSGQTLKSQADAGECVGIPDGAVSGGGGGEVLRALYDFKATIEQTLDFARHDIFILHSSSNKQKNWWHVINAQGKVGYIPSNYVETVQVSSNYLVSFITRCMQCIERSLPAVGGGESGGGKRHQLLKELAERRRRAEGGMRSPIPPRPPTRGPATSCPASPYANASAAATPSPTKMLKKSATVGQSIGSSVKPAVEIPSANESAPDLPSANQEEAPTEPTNQQEATDLPAANQESVQPESTNQEVAEPESPNEREAEVVDTQIEATVDEISAEDTYRLVQNVRFHTELSFEMSRVAVGVVASNLLQLLPGSAAHAASPALEQLLGRLRGDGEGGEGLGGFTPPHHLLDSSHDAERLSVVLAELVACKEDAQQRSWELYEDEDAIMEYLAEFTSIIKNADPAISRRVLSRDKCWQLEAVLEYYQMEVRWTIRSRLLDAFLAVCALHRTFVLLFLNSVLPVELARDMQSNVKDVPKLINSAKLLTVILSMGEPMPIPHLEQLGEEFVDFLLLLIEDPPEGNEQISEEFFVVLVSYNLQFVPQSSNIVVEALAKMTHATNFTEKLLFMLNREDDPVRAITQQKKYANSVLKLIVDIFVSRKAANLFYTNDINVLIDIIVRQLTDLSPGDEKRSQYLELCRLVLRNTDYAESQHRCDDLHKCFIHIFCEEGEASRPDQALVRDISNEFPHYFKT